jgi:hypothetical protein
MLASLNSVVRTYRFWGTCASLKLAWQPFVVASGDGRVALQGVWHMTIPSRENVRWADEPSWYGPSRALR